ncbi:hypothetical protein ACQ86F_06030 [Streptomyces venezuelae ATCC 10712]
MRPRNAAPSGRSGESEGDVRAPADAGDVRVRQGEEPGPCLVDQSRPPPPTAHAPVNSPRASDAAIARGETANDVGRSEAVPS